MYCKTCGKKLDGTEKFCSDCGSPIDYAGEVISAAELKAAAPHREEAPRRSAGSLWGDDAHYDAPRNDAPHYDAPRNADANRYDDALSYDDAQVRYDAPTKNYDAPTHNYDAPQYDAPRYDAPARANTPRRDDALDLRKSKFHLDEMDWDLKGYPTEEKKTDIVDFDWASVLEGKEKKAAQERRRASHSSEEDIYDRIQSDRHNDEFDWNLVHTMRIDKVGRSDLSLFHEEDEDLFSVDFIPPLNTADSYEHMVPAEEDAPTPSRGTVVIDRIDKSGIEAAASEAAGIQERDYAALGINVKEAPERKPRKIEKFYTFNRKNEEFQALLDAEYERIRQKVQAETEEEELKNAVLAAVEEGKAESEAEAVESSQEAEEAAPLTRGEVAKAAAESEADEAERLALEAERIAEEAAAKAKAAEEAAAKAALEAQAAEEALIALEEEEAAAEAARIAAEEEAARIAEEEAARAAAEEEARAAAAAAEAAAAEEAARIAAIEEAARIDAEEQAAAEAARVAQEKAELAAADAKAAEEAALAAEEAAAIELAAKAEEEARIAEEAARIAAQEAETKSRAAQLAAEEAAVDAELQKLNESHRALEAAVAEIEAEMQEGTQADDYDDYEEDAQNRKVSYTDIFDDDDDDEYEEEKKGGCKTLFLDLLIVILVIAVGIAALLVFLPDHAISLRIREMLPFGAAPTIDTIEPEETADNTEEATQPDPQPEPEPVLTDIETAISKAGSFITNLGEVSEDKSLVFTSGTDYGMEGVAVASAFSNDVWYKLGSGEDITYTDAVVSSVLEYYVKLMNKFNSDDDAVLELLNEDSQLYGELSAVSANPDVKHSIESLKFGEMRSNGSDFYALIKVTEKLSNADAPEVTNKIVYLQADNDAQQMKIINIVDVQ